ncbi:MAG: VacJ family lipoprotein [Gammaproteobacteria bacterium]
MTKKFMSCYRLVFVIAILTIIPGCATTGVTDSRDPFEGFNRGVYKFNQAVDNALFTPLGKAYNAVTPKVVNKGVSNFFSNLGDIAVVANDLMQFKPGQAVSDAARFIFNSTIGLLGVFDVSTGMGLPKHNEDFGQTLAHWGVGSGPYLMFPLFGPTTLRDATSLAVDKGFLNPVFYVDNTAARAGLLTLNYVDFKADLLTADRLLEEAALDKYEFIKSAYFEKRANLINDGADIGLPEE